MRSHHSKPTPQKTACVCQTCGTTFYRWPSALKQGGGKYCGNSCRAKAKSGANSSLWRGGEWQEENGYIRVNLGSDHKTRLHRQIMEEHLGRPLRSDEVVHHIDGDTTNNDLSNLQVMSRGDHIRLHHAGKKKTPGWSRNFAACIECGSTEHKHVGHGRCSKCYYHERYLRRSL